MVYKKIPSLFLFLLAFTVITISGYQCATQKLPNGRGSLPLEPPSANGHNPPPADDYLYPDDYFKKDRENDSDPRDRLPEEVTDSRCERSRLRNLSTRYGAIANFEFDRAALQDFKFGKRQNFDTVCARFYMDMSRLTYNNYPVYKGSIAMVLQTSSQIQYFEGFNSGHSSSDNRYNRWRGSSWRGDKNNEVNKIFHAIYEDEHSAIIIKLEDVRIRDIGDGKIDYRGAGEVYYKMFRISIKKDVKNTKGSCYSTGTYVKDAHTAPDNRNNRCWFITLGPYSCRPGGALNPKENFTNINIATNSYKCFSRLGRFWNLDIEEAFNDSVEDID